jgi:protein AFG1
MTSISAVCIPLKSRSWAKLIVCPEIVQNLQDLHDMLKEYTPPKVIHPSIESLKPHSTSFLSSLFHKSPHKPSAEIPSNVPKGLYMYGDVGSGKTMLMDMFYDTLPSNITSKTRIHFHNFMQDVHKRLHAMKLKHGSDLDAILYVAADIAEKASVLCFDEFQCTDVADAMILRRQACTLSPYYPSHPILT